MKGIRVLTTIFTVAIQDEEVYGLITYSIDQQIFKFKAIIGHKTPLKTVNLDELTNLELWGVNIDLSPMTRNGQFMAVSKIWVFILLKQIYVS